MFFASRNKAIVGYDIEIVAFESLHNRNVFVQNERFEKVNSNDLRKVSKKLVEQCRKYPQTIFGENREYRGNVMFRTNGDYAGIY